jgi:hypothetical protein
VIPQKALQKVAGSGTPNFRGQQDKRQGEATRRHDRRHSLPTSTAYAHSTSIHRNTTSIIVLESTHSPLSIDDYHLIQNIITTMTEVSSREIQSLQLASRSTLVFAQSQIYSKELEHSSLSVVYRVGYDDIVTFAPLQLLP